jgi:hypothetical protein
MKSSAARHRIFRERKREGKAILQIEVDEFAHLELLKSAGLLKEWDENDRAAVAEATARLLRALAAEDGRTRYHLMISEEI